MLHYTTRRNWKRIVRSRFLKPNSPFIKDWLEEDMTKSMPEIHSLRGKNFITAIPVDRICDWKKYGLMADLMDYTSGDATLTFPLEALDGVMVRDHYSTSTEYSIKKYGWNVFDVKLDPLAIRMGLYRQSCHKLFQEYMLSSRRLSETDLSEVKVPEIWIPFPIPVEKITAQVKPSLIQKVMNQLFRNEPQESQKIEFLLEK